MKKFLQKSCAWLVMLVAWFAVSMSAMAQEQSVTFSFYLKESPQTLNGITLEYYGYNNTFEGYEEYATAELYGENRKMKVTTEDHFIKRVELNRTTFYGNSYDWRSFAASTGNISVSQYDMTAYWESTENNTQEVEFTSRDVYLSSVTVYYVPAEMDDVTYTIDFDGTVPEGCSVTLDGRTYTADATYTIDKKFSLNSLNVTAALGWEAVIGYDEATHTFTIKFVEKTIDWAVFTSTDPEAGTIALDDINGKLSSIKVNTDTWIGSNVYYTEESIPAGFALTDANGKSYAISNIQSWAPYSDWWTGQQNGYNYFYVYLDEEITTAGTYTLTIPADAIPMYGEKVSPAASFVWEITAATKFDLGYRFYTAEGEKMTSGNLKTLTGFTLTAPEGVAFTSVASDAALLTYDNEANSYVAVEGVTFTLNENGTVSVSFATPYTVADYYNFRLAEGSIVAEGGLISKEARIEAQVNPYNGAFNLDNLTPAYGATVTGPVTAITFSIPADKTIKTLGNTITLNGEEVTVTTSVDNSVVTITLPEGKILNEGENQWYSIPDYFVVTEDDYRSYASYAYNINVILPPTLHIAGSSPADGATHSLDNGTVSSVTFSLNDGISYVYETNVPENITCVDAEGNAVKINNIVGWDYSINFNFLSSIDKAGTYTLTIPANTYEVDGKMFPATTVTFTVTAKTKFDFNSYNVTPRDNGSYTSIESIVLPVPEGVTFADGTETVTISVNDKDVDVEATFDATEKTITLAWEPAEVGYYTVIIPEGTFTSGEGLKNNVVYLGYEILPTLAVSDLAVDADGNYWTTFAFDDNYTLPEGYTPYKVVAVDDATGVLSVEEIVGTPKTNDVEVYFNGNKSEEYIDITSTTFIALDGKVSVERSTNVKLISQDAGGYYLEAQGSPVVYIITILDASVEIADIKLLGWNAGYVENSTLSKAGNVITVTSDGNWTNVGGLRFGIATGEYNAPIIPAHTGILVKASEAAGNVAYKRTYDSATANMTGNLLVGCTADATWNEADKTYYKFSLDADNTAGSAGFYWDVDGGASIQAHAGKAYLVLDTPAASNSRYLINGFGDLTGIDTVLSSEASSIYNLQGQRVNATAKGGVYVKNGKKFIVK